MRTVYASDIVHALSDALSWPLHEAEEHLRRALERPEGACLPLAGSLDAHNNNDTQERSFIHER